MFRLRRTIALFAILWTGCFLSVHLLHGLLHAESHGVVETCVVCLLDHHPTPIPTGDALPIAQPLPPVGTALLVVAPPRLSLSSLTRLFRIPRAPPVLASL